MPQAFHLSLPVHSLEESIAFYCDLLGAKLAHRDPSGYVNLELGGCQLTLHEKPAAVFKSDEFHFGINVSPAELSEIAEKTGRLQDVTVVDPGTALQRSKLNLRCPDNYLVEIKARN